MNDAPRRPSSAGDVVRGVLVSRLLGIVGRSPEKSGRRRRVGTRSAGERRAAGAAPEPAGATGKAKPGRPPLALVALGCFVVGVVLMIPFEATVTRILGVTALFAFIVTGLFAIARPDFLGADE